MPRWGRKRRTRQCYRLIYKEEAIIVAFRKHTLLPLDDCLYALQATIPHLTRSSLHRCDHGVVEVRLTDDQNHRCAEGGHRTPMSRQDFTTHLAWRARVQGAAGIHQSAVRCFWFLGKGLGIGR